MGLTPPWDPHAPGSGMQSLQSLAQLKQPKGLAANQARPAQGTWSSHEPAGIPRAQQGSSQARRLGRGTYKLAGSGMDTRQVSGQPFHFPLTPGAQP